MKILLYFIIPVLVASCKEAPSSEVKKGSSLIGTIEYKYDDGCFISGESKMEIVEVNGEKLVLLTTEDNMVYYRSFNSDVSRAINEFVREFKEMSGYEGSMTHSNYCVFWGNEKIEKTNLEGDWDGFNRLRWSLFGY